jgi:MFS family permease
MAWLPSYFERAFAMTPAMIGLGLGLCIGLASGIGALVGGKISVKLAQKSRSLGARYSAWVSWGVLVPLIASFYVPQPLVAMALLFLAFLVAGTLAGPVFGTVQDLVAPQARATAVAIIGVAGVIIGQGMGPMLVGMLSDAMHTVERRRRRPAQCDDGDRLDQPADRAVFLDPVAPHRPYLPAGTGGLLFDRLV